MRILQLHAAYRVTAGEETVVANEAAVLRAAGHEVRQLIVPNPTSVGQSVAKLALSLHNPTAARRVRAELEHHRPDVVHIHNTWYSLTSSVLFEVRRAGVPMVMTVHNFRLGCIGADFYRDDRVCTACLGRSPLRGVVHGCYRDSRTISAVAATELVVSRRRGVRQICDRYVAPSEFMRDRLAEIGVPRSRLVVKPHFTADAGPRPSPPSASQEILFIGRLAPGKGLPTLLRAWELFTSEPHDPRRDRRLVVIGDGPLSAELHESAPRGVEFTGWMPADEVRSRMLRARAFVFPSAWFEPFGMVLIEALSAGLPIVTCRSGDAPTISGAPTDLLAAPDDAAALADGLRSLSDDRVDAEGARNRGSYLTNYSPERGLADLEELYISVTAGRGHR